MSIAFYVVEYEDRPGAFRKSSDRSFEIQAVQRSAIRFGGREWFHGGEILSPEVFSAL